MYIREKCNLCLNHEGNILGRSYYVCRENCDVHWRKYFVLTGKKDIIIEFMICGACGNIFQKQLLDDDELEQLENVISKSNWIKELLPKHQTYQKTAEIINSQRFYGVYNFILSNLAENINGKHLLDVGGRTGMFGEPLIKYGIDYTIIDVEDYSGKNIPDSEFIKGDFDIYSFSKKFDIIIMNHILEHVYYPIHTLKKCNELLNDDGILFIDVPILPMSPGTWHRSEFYVKPLINNAVMRSGFKLINIEDVQIAYDNSIISGYRVLSQKNDKMNNVPLGNYKEYSFNLLSEFHYGIINYFVKTKEKFIIYGVNEVSQRLLQSVPLKMANFIGFVDDNPVLWEQELYGKKIYPPEYIKENREIQHVIILTPNKEETRKKLYPYEEIGIKLISNCKGLDTGDNSSMLEPLKPLADINNRIKYYENCLYNSANNGFIFNRAGQRVNNIKKGAIISHVSLFMDKVGNPLGTGSCIIRKVSDDSIIGIVGTVDISILPDIADMYNPKWIDLRCQDDIRIPETGDYRIVFEWDTVGGDTSNYPRIRYNDTDTIEGEFTQYCIEGKWIDISNADTSIRIIIKIDKDDDIK